MSIIKLTEPGSEHTMTIAKVEDDRSGSWPDWKFWDAQGNALAVPQKAMERQLTRVGVSSAHEMVGLTVRFSRSKELGKNNRPYYNADLADGPPPTPQRVQPPPRQAPVTVAAPRPVESQRRGDYIPELDDPEYDETPYAEEPKQTPREQADPAVRRRNVEQAYLALYGRVAQAVVKHHVDAHAVVNVPDLAAAVQSAAATIWISWDKRGLQP